MDEKTQIEFIEMLFEALKIVQGKKIKKIKREIEDEEKQKSQIFEFKMLIEAIESGLAIWLIADLLEQYAKEERS